MSKIYLMARYSRRAEMREYRRQLEEMGHTVTARWIDGGHELPASIGGNTPLGYGQRLALEDWEDLQKAEVCLGFTEHADLRGNRGRGGRHVEMGIALGRCIPILIVGPRENVFYYLPWVKMAGNWEDAKAFLLNIARLDDCKSREVKGMNATIEVPLPYLCWQQVFEEDEEKMKNLPTEVQKLVAVLQGNGFQMALRAVSKNPERCGLETPSVEWGQFCDAYDIIKALHKCHPTP